MISVRSHRQLLSGNKLLLILLIAFLAACSKKITPPVKRPDTPGELPRKEQQEKVELKPRISSIGLILPFYTNEVNPRAVTSRNVANAEIALEFYQGFKLALDSLTQEADVQFRLELFDAWDDETRTANLARAETVLNNDVLIGPIYPDGIKVFSELAALEGKVMVSPLAASAPSQFNNPSLVSLTNSIDQHGNRIAEYIDKRYQPAKVNIVLVNTRSSDDLKFVTPLKKQLGILSSNKLVINEVTNTQGIEKLLTKDKSNIVIVAPAEQDFVMPTINRLYKLKAEGGYAIDVFGHPNWDRLKIDINQLQALNTRITSSFYVDRSSRRVKDFVARYRSLYWADPSEYAFKGFDTGYYFGSLLAVYGEQYVQHIGSTRYNGLANDFQFIYSGQAGFRNSHLLLLQYKGYELKPVQ
ncbi:MAG TPA: ABC transporter substrate-binding protein [Sphingobacteriaceae bacterium]